MNPEALTQIQQYVAAGAPPIVTSVMRDAHAFHFQPCELENADFAIVNRNGNIGRAFQNGGVWSLVKNLGRAGQSPFSYEKWELANLTAPGVAELAQKMWLPDDERLTFLPKDLSPPKSWRRVIFRDQLFRFHGTDNGFRLSLGDRESTEFTDGKPWESEKAASWCLSVCLAPDAPMSAEAILEHQKVVAATVEAEEELADIWGQF